MTSNNGRLRTFLRKNAFYMVLGLCILAIALTIILVATTDNNKKLVEKTPSINQEANVNPPVVEDVENILPEDSTPTTVVEEIVFCMPVSAGTLVEEYADMAWNGTLKRYESHKAIDFIGEEGAEVYSVWKGKVESITKNKLSGTSIVIDHGDGLKTVYNSVAEDVPVTVGQEVSKGQVIGYVSSTNSQEAEKGAHLHFAVEENGIKINPNKYLVIDEK